MRDPFLDADNLEAYVRNQLSNRDQAYRKAANFRWPYLDAFPVWRDHFEAKPPQPFKP
jgi:hypothetical protein